MTSTHSLDRYLKQPSFSLALRQGAGDFLTQIGLKIDVTMVGAVCADVERTAARLTDAHPELGPFFIADGAPKVFEQSGSVRPFHTRVAFAAFQDVVVMLAEVGEGSDIFAGPVPTDDDARVHHLGFLARGPDLKVRVQRGKPKTSFKRVLDDRGFDTAYEALIPAPGVLSHISMFKTQGVANGLALSFLDFRIGGIKGIKTKFPRNAVAQHARHQVKHGPRVFTVSDAIPGMLKRRWTMKWSRQLQGTPAQVWPYIIVPSKMSRWGDAKLEMVQVGAQGKDDTPGMTRRITVKFAGIDNVIFEKIDATQKPNHIEYHAYKGGLVQDQRAEMWLEEKDGGTFFRWEVSFRPEILGTGRLLHTFVDSATESSLDKLTELCRKKFS